MPIAREWDKPAKVLPVLVLDGLDDVIGFCITFKNEELVIVLANVFFMKFTEYMQNCLCSQLLHPIPGHTSGWDALVLIVKNSWKSINCLPLGTPFEGGSRTLCLRCDSEVIDAEINRARFRHCGRECKVIASARTMQH